MHPLVPRLVVGILLGGRLLSGQDLVPAGDGGQAPSFSSSTELVLLNVMARDSRSRPISGLTQEAFRVFDNGRPQTLQFFMHEDAPVTIGVLVDNSGSMQPNAALVTTAAAKFVQTSNPRDEIFALTFNDNVREVLPPETPFTNDPALLQDRLLHALSSQGRTALHNALIVGLQYLELGNHVRKVLVVISDGEDTASATTADEVLARVQASNVVVYAVGLIDPVERHGGSKFLKRLAEATGGQAFMPDDVREVGRVLEQVARDIRESYTLAYAPDDIAKAAGTHRIRVIAQGPNGKRVNVRTRSAYITGSAAASGGEVER